LTSGHRRSLPAGIPPSGRYWIFWRASRSSTPLSWETNLGLDYRRQKRALDALEEAGVVVGVNKYKKGPFWRAPDMLATLDAFAERAGRRTPN
jgi:hypothetical protein